MIPACTGWNIKDWYMLTDTLTASMIPQRLKNEKIIGSLNFHLELFSFSEAKKLSSPVNIQHYSSLSIELLNANFPNLNLKHFDKLRNHMKLLLMTKVLATFLH